MRDFQIPFEIIFIGRDQRLTMLSSSFESITGYPKKAVPDVSSLSHLLCGDQKLVQLVESNGWRETSVSFEFLRRDGSCAKGVLHMNRLGSDRIVALLLDLTEVLNCRRAAVENEAKYRDMFENIPVGVFRMSPSGELIAVNTTLATMYGYKTPFELVSEFKTIHQLVGSEEKGIELLGFLKDLEIIRNYEVEVRLDSDRRKWISISVRRVVDNSGGVICYEGVVQDVTEKKKVEMQLLFSQKMEAIGRLAGGIAHDFNNLLTSILGYTSLILMDPRCPDSCLEKVKRIESIARSATGITKGLLAYARGGKYNITAVKIGEVIRKVTDILQPTRRDVIINLSVPDNLPVIEGDENQMEQVFYNLYVNAFHAMPEGGEISVRAESVWLTKPLVCDAVQVPSGLYVVVRVRDTGVGMDKETLSRIFEPFFTTKELGRGTGLGLAVVYGIVKSHRGFIDVWSSPGEGTEFTLYFPASSKEAKRRKLEENVGIEEGNGTILLVDDDENVLLLIKSLLETAGYTVLTARNGIEAEKVYLESSSSIQVVILDMIMPVRGGVETFHVLKKINPQVKVILLSGYACDADARALLREGAKAFFEKPPSWAELSRKIKELIAEGEETE